MQKVAYLQATTVWQSRLRQYRRALAKPWSEDMRPTQASLLCSPAKRSMLAMMSWSTTSFLHTERPRSQQFADNLGLLSRRKVA